MRTALITGASSGIGAELAKIFASKKANLILVARNEEKLVQLAKELHDEHQNIIHTIPADLSTEDGVMRVYNYCEQENIHIDYLINNAGFGNSGEFADREWKIYQEMIDLNVKGLTHLCHLFIPGMKQKNFGRIMNVASVAGFMPGPEMAVYYATKAYVLHFTEALNMELKRHKISVTALCPGPTDTAFQDIAQLNESRLFNSGRTASAQEVADFGFKAMMNGWRVAIPGTENMILAKASRWIPRSLVMKAAKSMNSKLQ